MNNVKILNKTTGQQIEITAQSWEVINSTDGMKANYEFIANVEAQPTAPMQSNKSQNTTAPIQSDKTPTTTESTADLTLTGKVVAKKS